MWICKHCKQEFNFNIPNEKANHSRWCVDNPKRKEYSETIIKANKKAKRGNHFTKAKELGLPIPESANKGKTLRKWKHTPEARAKISAAARKSKHRRLRKGMVEYKGIMLDSSWELALAKRLDEIEVEWNRPKCIPWIDKDSKKHNYFPDFYLPEFDIYLDPKNPHAVNVQKEKLNLLLTQYENIVIIRTLEECKTYCP